MMTLDTPQNESPRTAEDDTRAEECAKLDLTKMRVQLAIGNDPREAGTPVINREFSLPELAEGLTTHERRAGKFGAYFCAPMARSQRTGENAQPWQLVALDFDGKTGPTPDPGLSRAFFRDTWHCGYSTHSYTPDNGKHRVVILLSRAIDAAEYRSLFNALAAVLPFAPDDKLNHPDQPVFFPSCPPGSTPLAWVNDDGQPLDVDAWLTRHASATEAESRAERAYQPSGDGVIAAFNDAHDLRSILERHGYQRRGKRYLHPNSESGIPSVSLLRDGALCFSHSSSDPLGDAKPHDAFDVFAILEHGGDKRRATKAAAELLGIANARDTATPHQGFSPGQSTEKPTYSAPLNTGKAASLHPASTTLHIPEGCFVVFREDKPPTLLVDSLAARQLAGYLAGQYALNAEAGVWHQFTGTHWQPVHPSVWEEVIMAAMFVGCGEVGFRNRYVSDVGSVIRRGNLLPMPHTQPGKLPFQNGLLDLLTRDLEPITPDNAFSWCIPHEYRADGQCPTFLDWIHHATDGDEGKILMLRAFIAAALTGRADLQKFVSCLSGWHRLAEFGWMGIAAHVVVQTLVGRSLYPHGNFQHAIKSHHGPESAIESKHKFVEVGL